MTIVRKLTAKQKLALDLASLPNGVTIADFQNEGSKRSYSDARACLVRLLTLGFVSEQKVLRPECTVPRQVGAYVNRYTITERGANRRAREKDSA